MPTGSRPSARSPNGKKIKLGQVLLAKEIEAFQVKQDAQDAPGTPPGPSGSRSPRRPRKAVQAASTQAVQTQEAVPDLPAIVERMSAVGESIEDIAKLVGLPQSVLRERYKAELELAPVRANLRVKENLLRACLGDVTKPATISAIAWWTKNRCGWSEHVTADLRLVRSMDDLSDEELLRIAARGRDEPA